MFDHVQFRRAFAAAILALPVAAMLPAPANAQAAFRVGMKIASQRGYANPECYAQVFARHASRRNHPERRNYWATPVSGAFRGELWSRCGISR